MKIVDLVTYIPILFFIIMLLYLSHREMKKSMEQLKMSEKVIAQDRDALKMQVEERTQELRNNRIARMNELARAAEFGRLSQGLFHDLMTPLTSMVLHTEKLKDVKMTEASQRMTAYIKDIRSTLSREEAERECSLGEELDVILHLLSYEIRKNNVKIILESSDDCRWYGNPIKLRQIFSNLLSNSIDSLESTKTRIDKKIWISLIKNPADITICVEDNGCGIDQENIEKIFEPFFTTKPTDKGTGIGLATVRSIVEKNLKGTIAVQSTKGKGSVFTIQYKNLVSSLPPPHIPPDHV